MTPVSPQAAYDHWLKLGLLAGDFWLLEQNAPVE